MKPEDKILTYAQSKELKWFCANVTGLKSEFYHVFDKVNAFAEKFDRLEKTARLIEEFFDKHKSEQPDNYYGEKTNEQL